MMVIYPPVKSRNSDSMRIGGAYRRATPPRLMMVPRGASEGLSRAWPKRFFYAGAGLIAGIALASGFRRRRLPLTTAMLKEYRSQSRTGQGGHREAMLALMASPGSRNMRIHALLGTICGGGRGRGRRRKHVHLRDKGMRVLIAARFTLIEYCAKVIAVRVSQSTIKFAFVAFGHRIQRKSPHQNALQSRPPIPERSQRQEVNISLIASRPVWMRRGQPAMLAVEEADAIRPERVQFVVVASL